MYSVWVGKQNWVGKGRFDKKGLHNEIGVFGGVAGSRQYGSGGSGQETVDLTCD